MGGSLTTLSIMKPLESTTMVCSGLSPSQTRKTCFVDTASAPSRATYSVSSPIAPRLPSAGLDATGARVENFLTMFLLVTDDGFVCCVRRLGCLQRAGCALEVSEGFSLRACAGSTWEPLPGEVRNDFFRRSFLATCPEKFPEFATYFSLLRAPLAAASSTGAQQISGSHSVAARLASLTAELGMAEPSRSIFSARAASSFAIALASGALASLAPSVVEGDSVTGEAAPSGSWAQPGLI